MDLKQRYKLAVPKGFFLDSTELSKLEAYLKDKGWINQSDKVIGASRAGDGNMNLTLRVDTSGQSIIVKQSRPWVEKFPHIEAPAGRAVIEGRFYQIIQEYSELQLFTPRVIGVDKESGILVLEDLGMYNDFTFIYDEDEQISDAGIISLCRFISLLHNRFTTENTGERIFNKAMKRLNHEHLFVFPLLLDNDFDLDKFTPDLQSLSLKYKRDSFFKKKVMALGDIYLNEGDTLIHGDYYPAAWMETDKGIKIIDPEFSFFGPAEFDLGVFVAHLKMGRQNTATIKRVFDLYEPSKHFDIYLFCQFTGVEIMRRLLGIAQLPLSLNYTEKSILLDEAYELIMKPGNTEVFHLIQSAEPCV